MAEKRRETVPLPLAEAHDGPSVDAAGSTQVLVRYRVAPGNRAEFVERMRLVEHSRRRTGARSWGLYLDRESPGDYVELFAVGSWQEHLQQHDSRPTQYDDDTLRAAGVLAESVTVHHLVEERPDRRSATHHHL
ncbi:hypothetical protein GCM10009851_35330 [Herbiconiux moechotypicola]|uniref:ABM domain-containing protein n=1 Tax=Herbiconiux moechotypicola TaxID=637393 RepID=A0ABN3E366_9MICO